MKKILIVDDEEDIRDALQMILRAEGYDIKLAEDGNQALQIQREFAADLLITDIIMPDRDGISLIKMMHNDFPQTKIIAISGGGDPVGYQPDAITTTVYLSTAKMEGADQVMSKPFERNDIIQAVKRLLS